MRSLLLFLVLVLVACGTAPQSPKEAIVGKWETTQVAINGTTVPLSSAPLPGIAFEFFSDGSMTFYRYDPTTTEEIAASRNGVQGTYVMQENGRLTMSLRDAEITTDAQVQGNSLTLEIVSDTGGSTGTAFTLQRQ